MLECERACDLVNQISVIRVSLLYVVVKAVASFKYEIGANFKQLHFQIFISFPTYFFFFFFAIILEQNMEKNTKILHVQMKQLCDKLNSINR